VTFGGSGERGAGSWTYYETIGGGQGASRGANGPSGVHVGMSNTLNTPIEVLEMEHPLRVRTYALRLGSGEKGSGQAVMASCANSRRSHPWRRRC